MRRVIVALVASSLGFHAVARGEPASQPGPPAAASEPGAYVPDLGDIMETMQLRHFKLSYAGSVKNWKLADYELTEIKKSFRNAARFYPTFGNVALAKLIDDISEPALARIGDAIKAQDDAAFGRVFSQLTEACDSCHQAAGYGFITIRVPTASPFSNQSFPPN